MIASLQYADSWFAIPTQDLLNDSYFVIPTQDLLSTLIDTNKSPCIRAQQIKIKCR